jgi:hypothetical protein
VKEEVNNVGVRLALILLAVILTASVGQSFILAGYPVATIAYVQYNPIYGDEIPLIGQMVW